jgi:hypothetical protein
VGMPLAVKNLYGPIKTEWKPCDSVEHSGVYRVRHGTDHVWPDNQRRVEHQVICLEGQRFPSCKRCGMAPTFVFAEHGEPIEKNEYFSV